MIFRKMSPLNLLMFLMVLTSGASCDQVSQDKEIITIKIADYNVGAFAKNSDSSIEVIADLMKEIAADVVSVNEVDSCTVRTGKVNQLAEFAKKMGDWNHYFSKAMPYSGGAYGIGLVSRPELKIVRTDRLSLSQYDGLEPRTMALVEFEDFIVASCHIDYKTVAAQLGQIDQINAYMKKHYSATDKPIFLCGDFNCTPESEAIVEMLRTWKMISTKSYTYPSDQPKKCIDFVFMRNGGKVKVKKADVCRSLTSGDVKTASDHLPIYVELEIEK